MVCTGDHLSGFQGRPRSRSETADIPRELPLAYLDWAGTLIA